MMFGPLTLGCIETNVAPELPEVDIHIDPAQVIEACLPPSEATAPIDLTTGDYSETFVSMIDGYRSYFTDFITGIFEAPYDRFVAGESEFTLLGLCTNGIDYPYNDCTLAIFSGNKVDELLSRLDQEIYSGFFPQFDEFSSIKCNAEDMFDYDYLRNDASLGHYLNMGEESGGDSYRLKTYLYPNAGPEKYIDTELWYVSQEDILDQLGEADSKEMENLYPDQAYQASTDYVNGIVDLALQLTANGMTFEASEILLTQYQGAIYHCIDGECE
ncbi:MAG: DUF4397 domain-containing protein [Deltaproteobacteria bacterium]|nr:DUF4397 domain-containing protein [Deltaproteobacteria bacterium]